jgi:hypothetical protein
MSGLEMNMPTTVDQAVDQLVQRLPLREKTKIANMSPQALHAISPSLSAVLDQEFRLGGNDALLNSCAQKAGTDSIAPQQGALVIIVALWERLQDEHLLRIVK